MKATLFVGIVIETLHIFACMGDRRIEHESINGVPQIS